MTYSAYRKLRFRFVGLILSLAILWPVGLVDAQEKLSEILENVKKRYGPLQGLSIPYKREVMTRSMAMLGGTTNVEQATGEIHFKPPNFLKVEQEKPQKETITADGNTLWWYIPRKNQVYRFPSHELGKELQILSDVFRGLKAVAERFEVLLMDDDEKDHYRIRLTPNPPWTEIVHIDLSVSKGEYAIGLVEIQNIVGGKTRFILGKLTEREKFPEDFFKFDIPEGVKVIEKEG